MIAVAELGLGDLVSAVVEYLEEDAAIAEATADAELGQLVFGHELPRAMSDRMPMVAVVVSDAGGFADDLPEVLDRGRVDVRCYGATLDEAKRLAVLVRLRLRSLGRWTSSLGLVIHAATRSGGYIPLREQVGGWPLVLRSYLIPYDETLVA